MIHKDVLLPKNMKIKCIALYKFVLSVVVLFFCTSDSFAQKQNTTSQFIFPSATAEYSVTFPSQPTIKDVYVEGIKAARAELVIPADSCFLRAEYVPMPQEILEKLSAIEDDFLVTQATAYANANGLSNAETSINRNNNGRFVSVRGFKTISGVVVTYYSITFYGKNSAIFLYAGSPSKAYPTSSITKFLNSLKRNSSEQKSTEQNSKFRKLILPLGVSVEVPKNWWVFDEELNSTLETSAEAALNLANVELPAGKKVNLFRANSVPRTTYAGIAINATDVDIDPALLRIAPLSEIQEFKPEMQENIRESLSVVNQELLEFYDFRREFVGNHPALVIEYKRSGLEGPVIVQMTWLFLKNKKISLNLSYRESEAQIWKPIVQYIRKSLTVK
ncbi:MAG: hypothetical protein R2747_23120 [Pyrinomonadaceae bacterium]